MKKVFITICVLVSQSSSAVFLNDLDDTDASIERAWREAPYAAFGLRFDENGDAFRAGSGGLLFNSPETGAIVAVAKHPFAGATSMAIGFSAPYMGSSFAAFDAGDYYDVIDYFPHPIYDFAIVRLESLVPGIEAMPLYDGLFEEGQQLSFYGHGDYDFNGNWDGFNRAAYGIDIGTGAVFGEPELRYYEGDIDQPLFGVGTEGDSSGIVAVEVDEVEYWAGLILQGRGAHNIDIWTGYLPSDILRPFIDETIAQNPWSAPIPEPATLTLYAMGLLGLAGRRRVFRKHKDSL